MASIKKGDFVEVEYTGKIKEDNTIFDTTDRELAKQNDLFNEQANYGPVAICIGEHQIIKGLDKNIEGKETERSYTIKLPPEDAFGKKDAKLIQLIPTNKFKQQQIQPVPGLQLNIDGTFGTIKTVSGGRTMVDFNHPLSGREVVYEVKINKIINDDAEKISSYLRLALNIKNIKTSITNNEATVITIELPQQVQEQVEKKLKKVIPSVKKVTFVAEESSKETESVIPPEEIKK